MHTWGHRGSAHRFCVPCVYGSGGTVTHLKQRFVNVAHRCIDILTSVFFRSTLVSFARSVSVSVLLRFSSASLSSAVLGSRMVDPQFFFFSFTYVRSRRHACGTSHRAMVALRERHEERGRRNRQKHRQTRTERVGGGWAEEIRAGSASMFMGTLRRRENAARCKKYIKVPGMQDIKYGVRVRRGGNGEGASGLLPHSTQHAKAIAGKVWPSIDHARVRACDKHRWVLQYHIDLPHKHDRQPDLSNPWPTYLSNTGSLRSFFWSAKHKG